MWIRFFGKIYGRKSDYYIVYGSLPTYSIINKGNNEKAGKEGLNKYTFWVANSGNFYLKIKHSKNGLNYQR